MTYAKGCRRDAPDHPWRKRQRDARGLLGSSHVGALRVPGTTVSLRAFEKHTYNQLSCEGCTGHSIAFGVEVALAAQGLSLGFDPSPGDPYKLGRCVGRTSPSAALLDDGAQLADVATAISDWGMRPIGPLNPAGYTDVTTGLGGNVNVEPFFGDIETDARALVVGEHRVDLAALTLIDDACALLDAKIPLWVGGPVGPKYESYVAGAQPVDAEPDGDGHATIVVGYRVEADGSIVFENKTSWGPEFGDEGHVWVTSDWVKSQWDAYALTVREVKS